MLDLYSEVQRFRFIFNKMEPLKKAEFDAHFESNEKWQKNGGFDFYYFVQKFLTYNFFCELFYPFFNGFELGNECCVLWYPYLIILY